MTTFVGREEQLQALATELEQVRGGEGKPGRALAIRGRRQVGKSTLVEEFIGRAGVPSVFYVASRQPAARELELFGEAIAASETQAAEIARSGPLGSWDAALALLARDATAERPLILVIDELPYLVESEPAIEGTLQKAWDRVLAGAHVLLILVGSDLSTMEALGQHGRPLYGRARELVVPPLAPAEVGELLDLDAPATLDAYLAIGGFPRLTSLLHRHEDIWRFLGRELADPTSPLVVVGERSVNAELPADLQGRRVLAAIGSGERAYSAIERRSGVERTSLARSLAALREKRMVLKLTPYSSRPRARPPRYVVADPYLRFWLRFIGPNLELIERGRGDLVAERIRASWDSYRGRAIEPLARAAIERRLPDPRFGEALFVGGYWTRDGRVEVDLVGGRERSRSDAIDFVGSIKWRESRPFDRQDLAALVASRARVPGATEDARLVGVSRSGFTTSELDVELGPDDLLAA
ncbi:MAG: DUF234 domain-containing protein [Solirubrobacterales bacterium]